MIITNSKPYGVIKAQLDKEKQIGIVSCNSCARMCETGGKEELEELNNKLEKDGFKIVSNSLVGAACAMGQLKDKRIAGDVIISQACEAATFNLKKLFPDKKIISTTDTIGLAAWDEKGNLTLVREFK